MFKKGHKLGGSKKKIRPYRNGIKKNMCPEQKYQEGFLSRLDARTEVYMNLDKTYRAILCDLGGWDNTSRIERSLIERYIFAEYQARKLELLLCEFENGDQSGLMDEWIHLSNILNSIAKKLGIARRKNQGSELQEYMQDK